MSHYTSDLRSFTQDVRGILNETEYGFQHKDPWLFNSNVVGTSYCSNRNDGRIVLLSTVTCRHHCYPKWKLSTYLKLIDLLEKLNYHGSFEGRAFYKIQFTGNIPDTPFTRSFSEQMKIDICWVLE